MAFGLTPQGFALKRLEDIREEMRTTVRDQFGDVRTDPESVFGQIIDIFASREADWWEQLENVYNSNFPKTASGVSLDNAVSLTGTVRTPAQPANAVVQHEGTEGTTVPAGTQVSDDAIGEAYTLQTDIEITQSNLHKAVYTVDTDSEASYTITINGVANTFTLSGGESTTDIASGIVDEINTNLSANVTASNSTNTITVVNNDTDDVTDFFDATSESTGITITEIWTPGLYESVNTGDINSAAGAIDTIDTPVVNLNQVENLSASFGGSATQTDDELRAKQQNELQGTAAATLQAIKARVANEVENVTQVFVFENATETTDGEGRPPHSIEVVVDGGVEADIAQKIFDLKPAGIQTFGSIAQNVIDPNGDTQSVNFNRPTEKTVYFIIDITRNDEEVLPSDFATQIKDIVVETGNGLEIGEDVILQKFFGPIYSGVQGIATILIRAGFAPAPIGTSNLLIAAREFASFSAANIFVQDVTP